MLSINLYSSWDISIFLLIVASTVNPWYNEFDVLDFKFIIAL